MSTENDWQPGDPIYHRWDDDCIQRRMFEIKWDYWEGYLGDEAARWSPRLGWHSPND